MESANLLAISPVDGRYHTQLAHLQNYFSEYALIKYRVKVEVEYFLALADKDIFILPNNLKPSKIRSIYQEFNIDNAIQIKNIEKVTNHDVKAVEYFLKEKLQSMGGESCAEWVHFGLTSQDINNTAIPLLWKEAIEESYLPLLANVILHFKNLAKKWQGVPMLAHTHGQPASPTTMGKEWMVFVERLENQLSLFCQIPFTAKFGGATGNFNAHHVAFSKIDWARFGDDFLSKKLGLERLKFTTQIDHYDNLGAQFDTLKRINTILTDFCRDVWQYISMGYFTQKVKQGEVGSSAMPHKVNPIDFENAEGNLGVANALFEHLSAKLPISRLQRDLTDSTVLRNLGVPFAHSFLAFLSIEKGLNKIVLNKHKIAEDLEKNWVVIAEAIQTILRRENYPKPYEALKDLTRGKENLTQQDFLEFIDILKVGDNIKLELKAITPFNYTGIDFNF